MWMEEMHYFWYQEKLSSWNDNLNFFDMTGNIL